MLAEERIITNELVYIYQDLRMPAQMQTNISKRVQTSVKLGQYPKPEIVQKLIMQVEALYVYQILKSVILSQ